MKLTTRSKGGIVSQRQRERSDQIQNRKLDRLLRKTGDADSALVSKGERLYQKVEQEFQKKLEKNKEAKWCLKMMNTGTLGDKIQAMEDLIEKSPQRDLDLLNQLMRLAEKKDRKVSHLAIESLKKVFSTSVLPEDRKLKTFTQIQAEHPQLDDKQLIGAFYEDQLKRLYSSFIQTL